MFKRYVIKCIKFDKPKKWDLYDTISDVYYGLNADSYQSLQKTEYWANRLNELNSGLNEIKEKEKE